MRYFVTLNDREFPLRLEPIAKGGQRLWAGAAGPGGGPERELVSELLRPARQGRAALVRMGGRVFCVRFEEAAPASLASGTARRASVRRVRVNAAAFRVQLETELERRVRPAPSAARAGGTRINAPMPGRVVKVNVSEGDSVLPGTPLLSVEAMKMENELQSPSAGRVVSVRVRVGATVESDQELVVIAPES